MGDGGLADHLDWESSRSQDFRQLASSMFMVDHYPEDKFPAVPPLETWLQQSRTRVEERRTALHVTFKIFAVLAKDSTYNDCFDTRVSPVEFMFTGLLIWLHQEKFSLKQLAAAIVKMRNDVRAKHGTPSINHAVYRTMWEFVITKVNSLSVPRKEKGADRKSTRLNSSHSGESRMPSSA